MSHKKTCDEFGDALEYTVILEFAVASIDSDTERFFFRECDRN